jgi:hypothetical protein
VPDQLDEGWKFSISAGTTFGRVAKLKPQWVINRESDIPNPIKFPGDGENHRSGTEIVELGYLRSTTWRVPNYVGAGAKIVNNARTEIYPFIFGWTRLPASRLYYLSFKTDVGVRIDNPYLKGNPSSNSRYSLQFNFPLEFGWEI